MAIFAETLVEEGLNRKGFFTIRGAKGGLLEMDLLAVRYREDEETEAVHYEVQASTGPISWMTKWTPELQKELGIGPNNARRRDQRQMEECVNSGSPRSSGIPGSRRSVRSSGPTPTGASD